MRPGRFPLFLEEATMIKTSTGVAAALVFATLAAASASQAQVAMEQISPALSVRQEGADNRSLVEVSGAHQGDVVQVGDRNHAVMISRGLGASQSIAQYGADNLAVQMSFGGANDAAIVQGSAASAAYENIAVQAQAGSGNSARITQNGSRNAAAQVQTGTLSFGQALNLAGGLGSDLRQGRIDTTRLELSELGGGTGNTAELTQDGDENLAVMIQAGDHNQMDIHQVGGAANVYIQLGDGLRRSAFVEQRAGANGVTPITIIQSR
jgi:trimeric autotransporter adhesin